MIIKPKNWLDFQHYKDRCPPWIKLHKTILDDYEFNTMQDASKALAMCLWLVASENLNGEIDATPKKLAFRLRQDEKKILVSIIELIDKGFFIVVRDDSNLLAECKRVAPLEETETETETETYTPETEYRANAQEKRRKQSSTPRGSRLPSDWVLPKSWGDWAMNERPDLNADEVRRMSEQFRDYWIAKPGKDGEKADWQATWRNWVRNQKFVSNQGAIPRASPKLSLAELNKKREAEQAAWLAGTSGNVIDGECANV